MDLREGTFGSLLPAVQALTTRSWTPQSWAHAGQHAWSSIFTDPASPAAVWSVDGCAVGAVLLEGRDSFELVADPACPEAASAGVAWALDRLPGRPVRTMALDGERHLVAALRDAGLRRQDGPHFRQHLMDLAQVPAATTVPGYELRSLAEGETEARAACHRAAWSDVAPSAVTTAKYAALQATAPYDRALDWVAVDSSGAMVASCLAWLSGEAALLEPVGCAPAHRGRGLAGAVVLASLAAARDLGATTALVRPRGDAAHPAPQRAYQRLGFAPASRTLTFVTTGERR